MRREKWRFEYSADRLAEATAGKIRFHSERLQWWKAKRREVMELIRSEGIEIDERIVLQSVSLKARDWERSTQVSVRDDLRQDLAECQEKLVHHTQQSNEYKGWLEALSANPEQRLRLDIQDWLFFFGGPSAAAGEAS